MALSSSCGHLPSEFSETVALVSTSHSRVAKLFPQVSPEPGIEAMTQGALCPRKGVTKAWAIASTPPLDLVSFLSLTTGCGGWRQLSALDTSAPGPEYVLF